MPGHNYRSEFLVMNSEKSPPAHMLFEKSLMMNCKSTLPGLTFTHVALYIIYIASYR